MRKFYMKYIFIGALSFALAVPGVSLAHGMMGDFDSLQTSPQMMEYVEDQALENDELHEEMEGLMEKMMEGNLSETEASRLAQLMDEYPGPMGMMMGRMNMMQNTWGGNWGMMQGFHNGASGIGLFLLWFIPLLWIVWLVVGILAIVWLWKQIQKN